MGDNGENAGKNNSFPPGYEHVRDMVREAQQRIKEIDEQIKNVPKDQGPSPQYNPPGFLRPKQPGNREQTIRSLEMHKDQLRADIMVRVEKETAHADTKTARVVRDNAIESVYPNPYQGKDAREMQQIKGQSKDLEASQEFADIQRKFDRLPAPAERENIVPEQQDLHQDKEQHKMFSMSDRFMQSLSYTREVEKNDNSPDKSPDQDKGREEIDRD